MNICKQLYFLQAAIENAPLTYIPKEEDKKRTLKETAPPKKQGVTPTISNASANNAGKNSYNI